MGHASLMRPGRPLPTVWFVDFAATPRLERFRGDHRGQSSPGAWYLHFRTHEPTWKAHRAWSIRRICAPLITIVVIECRNVNGRLAANVR